MSITISRLQFEHHRRALGIAESQPRISWRLQGSVINWEQSSYEVEIRRGPTQSTHSFHVDSADSICVPWPDTPLRSGESAEVRVKANGLPGQPSAEWSDWTSVEAGLLGEGDWGGAISIAAERETEIDNPKRPVYFRKGFSVNDRPISARLYITALGVYEAEINGVRVGDYVLAPGWQSYNHRHVYNTFDVTGHISSGSNAIGVICGEGWFSGRLGFAGGSRNIYGNTIGLFALLVVTLADGTVHRIPTDDTWKSTVGPLLSSEIYDGEHYDSQIEADIEGWSSEPFNSTSWLSVKALPPIKGSLVPPDAPPVRKTQQLRPTRIFLSASNKTIVDFGQNVVGWLRVNVSGPRGSIITFRHAEVLENGELATRPLRFAAAADTLVLHGNGDQVWEPRFTYHGFRYAEVEGWPAGLSLENSITAVVIHTDMERTGWFKCSDNLLNKFHQNVCWSMRGNFVSIPTDCPQRDERLGWTGDALAFGPTSNYLYDTSGFWRSWHKDVWAEMQEDGKMIPPFFVPHVTTVFPIQPTAVWGDVTVAGPWNLYQAFGDREMLREQYSQSQAWLDTGILRDPSGLWDRKTFQFGDWLDPKASPHDPGAATTAKHLVADAYLVQMTSLAAKISIALAQPDRAEKYGEQHADLAKEFQKAWISNGCMSNETQTAYALGIHFDLFATEEEHRAAADKLRELVTANDHLVGTGFAGTPALGPALHKIGATEDFYRMLLQTKVPSWLYQVAQGGTTTWERWDSLLSDGSVNPGEMTSFNHYAFGSVADWMHQVIGGISPIEPGWKKFMVAPVPGGGLTSAETRYESPYGEIKVEWWIESHEEPALAGRNGFHLVVAVPPNTHACVKLPREQNAREVGSGTFTYHDVEYRVRG